MFVPALAGHIAADRLNPEAGRGWSAEVASHLPADHYSATG